MTTAIIEEAVYNRLANTSAVTALVSTRIYAGMAPPGPTPPLVIFNKISGPRVATLDGPTGLAQPTFQIDAYATTYLAAKNLANAVRIALDGWRATDGAVVIQGTSLLGERDGIEEGMSPPDRWFRCGMDYEISHTEATS